MLRASPSFFFFIFYFFIIMPDCLGHEKSHFSEKRGAKMLKGSPGRLGICKRMRERTPGRVRFLFHKQGP